MKEYDFEHPEFEKLNASSCREVSIKIHYPEFYDYLQNHYKDIPFKEKIYLFYHNQEEPRKCPICGSRTQFLGYVRGYREFCSYKCLNLCPDIQERKKKTTIEKYGVDNPMKCPEIVNKIKNSCMEKYGVENPFQSPELMKKARKTCMEKYGTEYALQNSEVKAKLVKTRHEKNLNKYVNTISIIPNDNSHKGSTYIMKCIDPTCDKCNKKEFEIDSNVLYDRSKLNVDLCTIRTPVGAGIKNTGLERFVQNILIENNINYLTNDRKILGGKELDIYVPDKNLAIECNGVYWHSMVDMYYHYNKWTLCQEKNIKFLNIWEDWITNKPDIVKSIVLDNLNIYDKIIDGKDCEIKTVELNESKEFLNKNHILGFCTSTVKYGLYYKNELVYIISLKEIKNPDKKNGIKWKILRACPKLNVKVNNALKVLMNFLKKERPGKILFFVLNDIPCEIPDDFKYFLEIKTNCWYIGQSSHERFDKIGETEDPQKYLKIHDSGSIKYILD